MHHPTNLAFLRPPHIHPHSIPVYTLALRICPIMSIPDVKFSHFFTRMHLFDQMLPVYLSQSKNL